MVHPGIRDASFSKSELDRPQKLPAKTPAQKMSSAPMFLPMVRPLMGRSLPGLSLWNTPLASLWGGCHRSRAQFKQLCGRVGARETWCSEFQVQPRELRSRGGAPGPPAPGRAGRSRFKERGACRSGRAKGTRHSPGEDRRARQTWDLRRWASDLGKYDCTGSFCPWHEVRACSHCPLEKFTATCSCWLPLTNQSLRAVPKNGGKPSDAYSQSSASLGRSLIYSS